MKRSGQQTLLAFYKKRSIDTSLDENSDKNDEPACLDASNPAAPTEIPETTGEAAGPATSEPTSEPLAESEPVSINTIDQKDSENYEFKGELIKNNMPAWKQAWIESLSPEMCELLQDEIANIGDSWLQELSPELEKPYFKALKEFLESQRSAKKVIFPPTPDIYSWSKLCKLEDVKVVILGQDPYHNYNQAHGLAFSVLPPTAIPPSLRNIYKELGTCYPGYQKPNHGLLTPWAKQGVLLLNACLTVEAHKANSHANRGWETFTEKVLELVAKNDKVVFMAWGTPAFKRISKIQPDKRHLVLKSVHPSPLSASRGWFGSKHFILANDWLKENDLPQIDWQV